MEIISLFNMLKLHQSVNDDILLEIFIRLPDRRSIIRCSAVCKHWFSIINSTHYHHQLQSQSQSESQSQCDPFTIMFRGFLYKITKPFYEYFPKEYSEQQNGGGTCLGFLPWPDLRIHSSVEDLLLISRENCQYFIICNPFTRQWIELPQIPLDPKSFWCTFYVYAGLVLESNNRKHVYAGLVLESNNRKQKQHQYKVMMIWYANNDFHSITFSSETGKWNRILFNSLTIPNGLSFQPPIVFNGLLHWHSLDQYDPSTVDGISAFDPFKDPDHPKYFRFIKFPLDLDRVPAWKSRPTRIRLGLVQGRLRLSQLLVTKRDGFVLKVWELNEDDDDDDDGIWTLVHDVTVKRWTENRLYFVVAFHPNNGNVLFLLHKKRFIYQFDIGNEKMRKVAQLPNGGDESFPYYLGNYVVMHHPLWPTPISALSYL